MNSSLVSQIRKLGLVALVAPGGVGRQRAFPDLDGPFPGAPILPHMFDDVLLLLERDPPIPGELG
eukprot:5334106-Alexandrium_andersonii.AAC.1